MARSYIWLDEILPDVEVDYENHVKCERTVIEPALKAAGYHPLGPWYTGDGDSFGPLSRCITTDRGTVVYG